MAAAYNISQGTAKAAQIGLDTYRKQVPEGTDLGTLLLEDFVFGVWNDTKKTFTPGGDKQKMIYVENSNAVYYNAVRAGVGSQALKLDSTGSKAAPPIVKTAFAKLFASDEVTINTSAIGYVPPVACLNVTNVGNPYRRGYLPSTSKYSKLSLYKDGVDLVLISAMNSDWFTCGYW